MATTLVIEMKRRILAAREDRREVFSTRRGRRRFPKFLLAKVFRSQRRIMKHGYPYMPSKGFYILRKLVKKFRKEERNG